MTVQSQAGDGFTGRDVVSASLVAAGLFTLTLLITIVSILFIMPEGALAELQESLGFFMAIAFAEVFCLIIGASYPIWRQSNLSFASLGFRPTSIKWIAVAALATIVVIAFQTGLSMSEFEIDFGGDDSAQFLVGDGPTVWRFILVFTAVVIGAPLAEEMFFRGVLFGWASQRWGFVGPAILTSLFFGVLHQQYSIAGLFLIGLVGFVAAALFYFSRSLWTAISYHAMNNGFAVILMFWFPDLG